MQEHWARMAQRSYWACIIAPQSLSFRNQYIGLWRVKDGIHTSCVHMKNSIHCLHPGHYWSCHCQGVFSKPKSLESPTDFMGLLGRVGSVQKLRVPQLFHMYTTICCQENRNSSWLCTSPVKYCTHVFAVFELVCIKNLKGRGRSWYFPSPWRFWDLAQENLSLLKLNDNISNCISLSVVYYNTA